jgi:hypothetical protein
MVYSTQSTVPTRVVAALAVALAVVALVAVMHDSAPPAGVKTASTTALAWRTTSSSPTFLSAHNPGDKTDAECKAAGHLSSCGQECCKYCDDLGCCDSDASGTHCKSTYDRKKKEIEEGAKKAACGDCTDCAASKVAEVTGEPTASCAMVKSVGYCGNPMGSAMCPVACGHCKSTYDRKKKEIEEGAKKAACGHCTDCAASKVAEVTGEPTASCAMVKSVGYCGNPMGSAMCPVACGKC